MRRFSFFVWAVLAVAVLGCDDDDGASGSAGDSSAGALMTGCEDDQVVVSYFGPEEDQEPRDECEPWPEPCDGVEDPCLDDACVEALYALCEAPSLGAGCSSVGPSTFVSCNE